MYRVVFVTVPTREEGQSIARDLLERRLCACVNIVDRVSSFFWWEGKIDTAQEFLLVIKTRATLVKKVTSAVKALHSYKVCEVIAVPIQGGNRDYLNWIGASCGRDSS